ncbi:unnamed protein product [Gordionus sp. m RMFG-2023]
MNISNATEEHICHSIVDVGSHKQIILTSEWVLYCLLTPLIIIVGFLGNACIIYVLTKGYRVSTTAPSIKQLPKAYTYIKLIAIFDLLSCIMAIPWPILYYWGKKHDIWFSNDKEFDSYIPYYYQRFPYVSFLSVVEFPLKFTFSKTSDILIIVLSIDRYIAIRFLLSYNRLQGLMNVKYILTSIIVLCFLLGLPMAMWYSTAPINFSTVAYDCIKFNRTKIGSKINSPQNCTIRDCGNESNFLNIKPNDVLTNVNPRVAAFQLISNKAGRKIKAFLMYEIFREILLTYIPLVLLFIININIIIIFSRYIKRKQRMAMTGNSNIERTVASKKSEKTRNRFLPPKLRRDNFKVTPTDKQDSMIIRSSNNTSLSNMKDRISFTRLSPIHPTTTANKCASDYSTERRVRLSKKEKILTYTLITLIGKYLIFTIPIATVNAIYLHYYCPESLCLFRDIVTLVNFLEIAKSCTNFFIYYFLDNNFTRMLNNLRRNV